MSSTTSFKFGIEIEILVKPKNIKEVNEGLVRHGFDPAILPTRAGDERTIAGAESNRRAIREAVAEILTAAGINASIKRGEFEIWTVEQEGSLSEVVDARGGGYWAIELISPILRNDKDWITETNRLFSILRGSFDVLLTKGCATHIHISPENEWEIDTLRGLLKATGVFDEAITKIMPAERKLNPYARSNYHDGLLAKDKATPGLKRPFDEVPEKSWKPLFDFFHKKIKFVRAATSEWGQDREVSWNLACLSGCGSVEFRRPPGVKTAADAEKWIAFAVAFACAAAEKNWHAPWESRTRHATVAELQAFIARGLHLLGPRWQAVLNPRTLVEDTSPPKTLEYFDLEELKRKLAKSQKPSGYEEKVIRSRQNSPASSHPSSPAARKTDSRPSSPASARSNSPAAIGARSNSPAAIGARSNSPAAIGARSSSPTNRDARSQSPATHRPGPPRTRP